jgi:hypothetical protein
LHTLTAPFRVGGLDRHSWRVGIEGERLGGQGPQFVRSEPGPHSQLIEHDAIRTGQLVNDGAFPGGLDEFDRFIGGQGPSNPAAVGIGVLTDEMSQGVRS